MKRLHDSRTITACLLAAALVACDDAVAPSTGPDDPPEAGEEHVRYDPDDPCKYTIDEIVADLGNDYEVPTWEMLDCYRQGLTRTRPAFVKRILIGELPPERRPAEGVSEHLAHIDWIDDLWESHPVNVSSYLYGTAGPFVDIRPDDPDDWTLIEYPLYPDHHDSRLRYGIATALREKLRGRPVLLTQFVPPEDERDGIPVFETADAMKEWVREIWIPWRVAEAKAAERYMIDYYAPTGELEALFQRQHVLLETLPPAEQVELVQWMVDEVRDAVRPHYHGVLLAYSYFRAAANGEHWNNMSYAGYDELAFPLIPECDVANVEPYMNELFAGYSQVLENSGNIPWRVSELDMVPKFFTDLCDQDFAAIEADLYREALRVLEDPPMPSKPVGVNFGSTLVQTDEAWQVIDQYYARH